MGINTFCLTVKGCLASFMMRITVARIDKKSITVISFLSHLHFVMRQLFHGNDLIN